MNTATVIRDTLFDLQARDFRNGFEDTVLRRVCKAVADQTDHSFWDIWRDATNISHPSPSQRLYLIQVWLGNDPQILDLWIEVDDMAKSTGSFTMPEWGTYGT